MEDDHDEGEEEHVMNNGAKNGLNEPTTPKAKKFPMMVVQPDEINNVRVLATKRYKSRIDTQHKRLEEKKREYNQAIQNHASKKEAIMNMIIIQKNRYSMLEKLNERVLQLKKEEKAKKEKKRQEELARKKEEEEAKHRAFMNAPIPKKVKSENNTPKTPRGMQAHTVGPAPSANTINKMGRRQPTPGSASTPTPASATFQKRVHNPHRNPHHHPNRPSYINHQNPHVQSPATTPHSATPHSATPFSAGVATPSYAPGNPINTKRPSTPPSSSVAAHFPSKNETPTSGTPSSANKLKFFAPGAARPGGAGRRQNFHFSGSGIASNTGGSSTFSYSPGSAMNNRPPPASGHQPNWQNRNNYRPPYSSNQNRR